MSKASYFVRKRSYKDAMWVDLWLVRKVGSTEHSILWGSVSQQIAEEICTLLALRVECETMEYRTRPFHQPGCATVEEQLA